MKKDKILNLLRIVIFTISLALGISLLLQYIPNLVVRIVITAVLFLALFVILFVKHKDSLLLIAIPTVVALIMPYYISANVIQMIIAVILLILLLVSLFARKVSSPFKAVMVFLVITVLLTWVFPTTYYSYSLVSDGKLSEIGLFDLLNYGNVSLSYFGNIAFYILAIGVFYGVLHKIGAYRLLLNKMAKKSSGKEWIVLTTIIVLLACLTSVCGVSIGLWFIIPFIVSLVLVIGYDKLTAALVSVGSIVVGMVGTTFSSTYIAGSYNVDAQNGMGVLNSILKTNATDLLVVKIILLVVGIGLLILTTLLHAKKVKNNKETINNEYVPNIVDEKQKTWPIVLIIDLLLVIVALSMTSWVSVFKFKFFENLTTSASGKFGLLLGEIGAFEKWGVTEVASLVLIGSIILGLVYKVKLTDYISNAFEGMKKALKPALLAVLIYVVLVSVSYNPVVLTIVKPLLSKHLNVFTMGLVAFITSIFNVDMYYAVSSVLPYVTTDLITNTATYPTIALIWQVMYGFMCLVAPTSIILIPVLSYLDISYKDWFKSNWLFILGMLVLSLLTLIVLLILL